MYSKTISKIRRLVKTGMKHRDIAHQVGTTTGYITSLCSQYGIKKLPTWSKRDARKLKTLIRQGFTYKQTAKKLHKPLNSVLSYCFKYGVEYQAFKVIAPKIVMHVVELLKKNLSSREIREIYPQLSQRQVLYYKTKYNIKGLSRGGITSIPKEELDYLRELSSQKLSGYEMAKEMMKKFNKSFTYEQIRGRCRHYNIPMVYNREWTNEDKNLLKSLITYPVDREIYLKAFPGKSFDTIGRRAFRLYGKRPILLKN